MNLQEILEDADLLSPNAFSIKKKIGWANQVQRQLHREVPTSFTNPPQDLREDNLTMVPRFPVEYHELFSLGVAKRIAERTQDFKSAGELEGRYHSLLTEAIQKIGPKLQKVQMRRNWR